MARIRFVLACLACSDSGGILAARVQSQRSSSARNAQAITSAMIDSSASSQAQAYPRDTDRSAISNVLRLFATCLLAFAPTGAFNSLLPRLDRATNAFFGSGTMLQTRLPRRDSAHPQSLVMSADTDDSDYEEFTIELVKGEGEPLGISIDSVDEKLLVKHLKMAGVIQKWNYDPANRAVKIGDYIVEINGQRGDSQKLKQEIKESSKFNMVIARKKESKAMGPPSEGSNWRPDVIDPMGKARGAPKARNLAYQFWMDFRNTEERFALMEVNKLFFAVRQVVDEADKALPDGSRVDGFLYAEDSFDPLEHADRAPRPIYIEGAEGLRRYVEGETLRSGTMEVLPMEVRLKSPKNLEELRAAEAELEGLDSTKVAPAIALPFDGMLWACALTGLTPDDLEAKEWKLGA